MNDGARKETDRMARRLKRPLQASFGAIILLLLPFALAANDPGHDTLYLEESGEQNLTGSLNVSRRCFWKKHLC